MSLTPYSQTNEQPNSQTIIIGAGPAGLAMAGQLAHRGLPFTVIEASDYVGFAWRNHYDRLHLHTVKQYSALPHLPYPAHYPTYVARLQFVEYLERYVEHFGIKPKFGQRVIAIHRSEDGTWRVRTETDAFVGANVVVATGYNRVPNVPDLPGSRDFRGIVWHSREYRNGAPFAGENVLIVGMGNTGAELALDLLEHGAKPVISVRRPINIVRRDVFGRPAQPTAIFLNKFPNWFYDFVAGLSQKLTVGDLSAYGLGKPKRPASYDTRQGRIPVIDLGTLDQIKAGNIRVVPGVEQVNRRTVRFTDGQELPFDAIILATGYRPGLASLLGDELAARTLNERGYPRALWFQEPALRGLYFLGFKTPLTGILYGLNGDSAQIAEPIRKQASAVSAGSVAR